MVGRRTPRRHRAGVVEVFCRRRNRLYFVAGGYLRSLLSRIYGLIPVLEAGFQRFKSFLLRNARIKLTLSHLHAHRKSFPGQQ
jgi:hypothetical protein